MRLAGRCCTCFFSCRSSALRRQQLSACDPSWSVPCKCSKGSVNCRHLNGTLLHPSATGCQCAAA